jgi:hypothetical protein
MEIFEQLKKDSARHRENSDCAVKAVCVATGVDYDTVHALFAKHGRRHGRGTPQSITYKVIDELGFDRQPVLRSKEFWRRQAKTIRSAERVIPSDHGYIIHSACHLTGVVDGKVHDWAADGLKRVKQIWRIVQRHIEPVVAPSPQVAVCCENGAKPVTPATDIQNRLFNAEKQKTLF